MKANNGHGYLTQECFGRDGFADSLSFPLLISSLYVILLEQYCRSVVVYMYSLCSLYIYISFLLSNPVYFHTFTLFKLNRYLWLCIKCCNAKGSLSPTQKLQKLIKCRLKSSYDFCLSCSFCIQTSLTVIYWHKKLSHRCICDFIIFYVGGGCKFGLTC